MKTLTLLLLSGLLAHAHRPAAIADRMTVEDPTISWTFRGEFETGLEAYVLELTFDEPIALPFEMLTPREARYELHRPWYAIVGPGLPEPSDADRAVLPYEVPEGWGAFIERNDAPERDVWFESIVRENLWSSGTTNVALQAGENEIWVWSANLTTGPFQIAFGVEEDFSDFEVSDMLGSM